MLAKHFGTAFPLMFTKYKFFSHEKNLKVYEVLDFGFMTKTNNKRAIEAASLSCQYLYFEKEIKEKVNNADVKSWL